MYSIVRRIVMLYHLGTVYTSSRHRMHQLGNKFRVDMHFQTLDLYMPTQHYMGGYYTPSRRYILAQGARLNHHKRTIVMMMLIRS